MRRLCALVFGVSLAACGATSAVHDAGTTGMGGAGGTGGAGGADLPRAVHVDVAAGPWAIDTTPTAPVPMDDVTVFGFSQESLTEQDPQLLQLAPDLVVRAWNHWDLEGTSAADFDFSYIGAAHGVGTRFIGGEVATVVFADERPADFDSLVTRDGTGTSVSHDNIVPGLRRGSLANPAFRAYKVALSKLQIDGGVDGLFFDEVLGDYQGAAFDGNEGFDDYHLADFNAYLLWRFPAGTDFQALFQMTADNRLSHDHPPGDLEHNFDYLRYLRAHGWGTRPFSAANPLAAFWTAPDGNRPAPGSSNFPDLATPYRYWKQIVDEVRTYARQTYGRELFITSNGIFPYCDFQSVGLYDGNRDAAGGQEANYVPVTSGGHLDGQKTLQDTFRRLRARSEALAPGAPVVLFMDWPGGTIDRYDGLPAAERQDYWRIYAAEAYANGLFFAFHLRTTTGEPTAAALGMMPFFEALAGFYRAHGGLYHGVTPSAVEATTIAANVMLAVADQITPHRRLLHVVNHQYDAGFQPRSLTVTVPSDTAPVSATLASPDGTADVPLDFTFASGQVTIALTTLLAYDVVVLAY